LLSGKYITPEFSPYKVRIVIGPDSASVKDPQGAGQGKVAIAETHFEISVLSVKIRIQEGIKEAAKLDEYKLKDVLVIDPRGGNGDYAHTAKLPKSTETARVRVPMSRHVARTEDFTQGGNAIGNAYMNAGPTKFAIDANYYTRPELPIEFEPHLKSRDATVNNDVNKRGLFEKDALGPLKIEPVAEDFYVAARYPDGGALATDQRYFKNAAFKIKQGTHAAPFHNANDVPEHENWQARIPVTVDGTQDFTITTFNATSDCGYQAGADELTVYLNRALVTGAGTREMGGYTKLDLSALGNDTELDNGTKDYREIPAGGPGPSVQIRLAPNFTKNGDVVWVVRASGASAPTWNKFPPGPNCHDYYGGVRGIVPSADLSNYFRSAYSPDPGGTHHPIVGKTTGTYPYTAYVNLRPATAVPQNQQERVEISVLTSGSKLGLAGVLFSPSWICGDSYVLHAWVEHQPYERNLGFIQPKPKVVDSKTGQITVWRRLQFKKSMRMPLTGTAGLNPGVGMGADALAPYRGDGLNMNITAMNVQYADAFHEWTIPDKTPVHQNVNLKKYRKAHNLFSTGLAGKVPLNRNSDIRNQMARYDSYREQLPPGVALPNLATNIVNAQPVGTPSQAVGIAINNAAGGIVVDPPLTAGIAAALPVYGGGADDYFMNAMGRWDTIVHGVVDVLTPVDAQPRKMNVVRWQNLHETNFWNDLTGGVVAVCNLTWEGECMGDGNSIFLAANISATLFAHEMGHSAFLAHFIGMDVNWKHHDLNTPGCLMSYNFTRGWIWKPGGAVGPSGAAAGPGVEPWPLAYGGTDVEHGWPHRDRNPATASPAHPLGVRENCIRYGRNLALGGFCAKCILKLSGWDEEKLPAAWLHPDLF
jgi:hypothetical protein